MSNVLADITLGVTLDAKNISGDLSKNFKEWQNGADKNTITYKIAGDKSSMESMLKQIHEMKPELLTNIKLNFDKSDYDRQISFLKGTTEKTAKQIGENFKSSISSSLEGFSISEIIGKDSVSNAKDVGKLKAEFENIMSKIGTINIKEGKFDLSKVNSVKELEEQAIALNKIKIIFESLSSHRKDIETTYGELNLNGMLNSLKDIDLVKMLGIDTKQNKEQIDVAMTNIGNTIKTNASQWSTTLESAFTKEFGNIVNLLNSLQDIINGVFGGSGTGGSSSGAIKDVEDLRIQIEQTTKEIEELEKKLVDLNSKKSSSDSGSRFKDVDIEAARNRVVKVTEKANWQFLDYGKGKDIDNFKNLVNEYMQLGGLIDKLTPGAKKLANSLKIEQIIPINVTQEIENTTKALEEAKKRRDELINQQQTLSGKTGNGTGTGTGLGGTGGSGTPTTATATVSPVLSSDFKQKLQEQVTAIGTVDATVGGKLSETFKSDVQTAVDNVGKVDVRVSFSDNQKDGKKQEIPVNVTTTPKLSETFQSDLQKLVNDTGKYKIKIDADSNNQDSLVPVNVKVGNGEDFKSELKNIIEGNNGLPVKVNPTIDKDFKLEIANATLKDVKVEGSIQGGNLKPDSIEKPTGATISSDGSSDIVSTKDKLNDKLEETKQKHEEVGQAAQKSSEVQKRSLLEVVKEIEKVNAEQKKIMDQADLAKSNNEMLAFIENKKKQAQEYTTINDLIAKIQSKMAETSNSKTANLTDMAKHYAGIIEYVERLKVLMKDKFSYKVLGENGEQEFNRMKNIVDQVSGSTEDLVKKAIELNGKLNSLNVEKSGIEKTATHIENLEVKLYNAVKAVEKLKAISKKNGKYPVTFTNLFKDFEEYRANGGKLNISDFTNEEKVINAVTKAYNDYIVEKTKAKAIESKKLQTQVNSIKKELQTKFPEADLSQYTKVFDDVLAKKKTYADAYREIRESILETQKAANDAGNTIQSVLSGSTGQKPSDTTTKTDPNKPAGVLGKGEVVVTPKVEDPVSFASQVTEQLKGQSATIDVKPNIVWDNASTSSVKDSTQNKEIDTQIVYYNHMIEKMNEYIELQKTIEKGNKYITQKGALVYDGDLRKGVPTQTSVKRKLDEYLTYSNAGKDSLATSSKDKLAAYVYALNDANKAQKIFGVSNKALFEEIQQMIEKSKASLEAYNTAQAKLSGVINSAGNISQKESMTFGQRDILESILKTGDVDKAVQHLQQVLGLQIPQAAQQAKTAIDGIGEQAKQEGQEVAQAPIPIKVSADISYLNTDIQSKKEQISPVDVNLSANIESLNTSIQSKKDQILPADVNIAVNKESIENLNTLDSELNKIAEKIQKIVEKPLSVTVDYSSIKSLYEVGDDGKSSIDKLKASIDGLQTGVLSDLKKAFQGFSIDKNLASRIEEVAKSLSVLKITLNNIDSNSTGFLNTIKELSGQATGLKELATVISASKEKIQKAKDEINNTGKKSENKSQANDKEKYTVLKDTLNEVLRLTKEYNKERNAETKEGLAAQIQLYKDRSDTLQLELWDLEKINEVEQNRIDIIQEKIRLEEQKQSNKELAYLEKQIAASESLEDNLLEQYIILAKDSNEWQHALEILSLYKDELKDIVKITRNINVDRNTGFKSISYQFTDSDGSTKTVGANSNLLMDNTKVADLNTLYQKLNKSANEYYASQVKIIKGDTSSKTSTDSLIAYNNMLSVQKEIAYWKEKGLVPSKEQLQVEEKIAALKETYKEQEQKTGLNNMYTTVLNTVERLTKKQEELNNLKLKANGTNEFAESIKNTQENVSLLIGTLRGFKFEDFFTDNALSSLGLNGSSLLFDNDDLNSLKWVLSQLPFTEEQIQKINDALDKNTLIKEKNVEAQNRINTKEQENSAKQRVNQANENLNMINASLVKQYDLTEKIIRLEREGGHDEEVKSLNSQLVEEIRNCNALVAGYKTFNDVVSDVDTNLDKVFSESRQRFDLLDSQVKDKNTFDSNKIKNNDSTILYSDRLEKAFRNISIGDASFSEVLKTNGDGSAVVKFIELIDNKVRTTTLSIKDMDAALDELEKGKFNVENKNYSVSTGNWTDIKENDNTTKNKSTYSKFQREQIEAESKAQKELNSLIDQYISKRKATENAKNLVDKKAFDNEAFDMLDRIEQKIISLKNAGLLTESQIKESLDKVNMSEDELTKKLETRRKAQEALKKENGIKYNAELSKTNELLNKAFKPNVSGFESAFNRAKVKVEELNNKLLEGKISDVQTGYTDKVNAIIQELNKVIGVTSPLGEDPKAITQAEKIMRQYANTINDGNVSVGDFNQKTKKMIVTFEKEKGVVQEVELSWNSLTGEISATPSKVKKAQSNLTRFIDGLKQRFMSLGQYLISFVGFYRVWATIKSGINVIRDLDTALTEMRKVSDESVESLKNFQKVSFDIANSVGTTAKQIQNSTADWMRLGESLDDAAESAKVANILLNVSEFESIDEATESLVSMSAAYKELDKIDIVDKLNLIGNNFAISTDGLATALQNSASALKTAQNDIDESIALATAANAVVQDPDKVGAGLRTIALRITGTEAAKEELAELGEDVDDYVVATTSKLNEQVMKLTKTVGKEGISLLDDNGNYRSTYEILQDIADVWEQIAKEDLASGQNRQNALLEMLAGKNRSNILASILQSPETLRDAYESSVNDSEGSAQKELEKYLDSIEGKIAQFTNEVQEFWHNLIDSNTIKMVVDAGTWIVDKLGKIVDLLGEIGTAGAALGAAFSFHVLKKNSGGRDKKFSLVIKYATESFSREVCEF